MVITERLFLSSYDEIKVFPIQEKKHRYTIFILIIIPWRSKGIANLFLCNARLALFFEYLILVVTFRLENGSDIRVSLTFIALLD